MPVNGKLNPTQQYLLSRIPGKYQSLVHKDVPDPAHIAAARALIVEYEAEQSEHRVRRTAHFEKLKEAAKEAVFMKTEEEALAAIKEMEAFGSVEE